jgi:SAM-dependent methyltransferase
MYAEFAQYYDAIYRSQGKDYEKECWRLHLLIQRHKQSPGNLLLDVACGTGGHLEHLRHLYEAEGLDNSQQMLAIARQKLPGVPLHRADMRDFDLGRRYDGIVCLFGSIGYVETVDSLEQTIRNMARHLISGGVLVVEPWLYPEEFQPGHLHAVFVDEPELKLARLSRSWREGNVMEIDFHFLVATPEGIQHFTEVHRLGLFEREEYVDAFEKAGLKVLIEPEGLGRELFIGVKPAA